MRKDSHKFAIDLLDDPDDRTEEAICRVRRGACVYCGVVSTIAGRWHCPFNRWPDNCEDYRQQLEGLRVRNERLRYVETAFTWIIIIAIVGLLCYETADRFLREFL